MRKIATLIIAFAGSQFALNAQTLTRSEVFDVGSTQVYRKCDTTGVQNGNSGTGNNWDYSSLVSTGTVGTNDYVATASHPQGSFYAAANMTADPANDAWQMFSANTDSIHLIGEKSLTNTRLVYTDGASFFKFPMAFATPLTDSVEGTYPDGFISSVTRFGYYQVTFDAEGSLITPFATFPTAKRVEYIGEFRDSSWTGVANSDVILLRYEWYVPGRTMPVLIIHNSMVVLNNGNPQVGKEVWFADDNAVSIETPMLIDMVLSPNPTNGDAKLLIGMVAAGDLNVEVFNLLGERLQVVSNSWMGAGTHEFDLKTSGLAKGIYLVKATRNGETETRKLILN